MPRPKKAAALKTKSPQAPRGVTKGKGAKKASLSGAEKENQPSPKIVAAKSPKSGLEESKNEAKKGGRRSTTREKVPDAKPILAKEGKGITENSVKGSPLQPANTRRTPNKQAALKRRSSLNTTEKEDSSNISDENTAKEVKTSDDKEEISSPPPKKAVRGAKAKNPAPEPSPKPEIKKVDGRKGKKAQKPEPMEEETKEPGEPKPQGKRRGRPSTNSAQQPKEEEKALKKEEEASDIGKITAKPRRGRPSAAKSNAEEEKISESTIGEAESSKQNPKSPAPKKKAGRGKKAVPEAPKPGSTAEEATEADGKNEKDTSIALEPAATEQSVQEKPKNARKGRKPKNLPQEKQTENVTPAAAVTPSVAKKPNPKGEGSVIARRSEMYNKIRLEKIAERNNILSQMGLLQAKGDVQKIRAEISQAETQRRMKERRERAERRKAALLERRKNRPEGEEEAEEGEGPERPSYGGEVRRSGRVRKRVRHAYLPAVDYTAEGIDGDGEGDEWVPSRWERDDDSDEEVDYSIQPGRINRNNYKYTKPYGPRPQTYGAIPGVPSGESFESREEANWAGIHRPTVAGISGSEIDGAYSICMNGGYEDDVDYGNCFTFTGAGGRDLKGTKAKPKNLRTAPQSKNQSLIGVNLSLAVSCEEKKPVRVMRGYKLKSAYAPTHGYRYDGLYTVEKFYETTGLSGFQVFCFIFKRCEDQPPPPWATGGKKESNDEDDEKEGEDEEGEEEEENEEDKTQEEEEQEQDA